MKAGNQISSPRNSPKLSNDYTLRLRKPCCMPLLYFVLYFDKGVMIGAAKDEADQPSMFIQ